MKELMNQAQEFMYSNPHYAYLLVGVVCGIFSIGNFKEKKWAVNLGSAKQRMLYDLFGEKRFARVLAIVFAMGSLAGFVGFYLYASGSY